MVDYYRNTGTTGRMMIRDTGVAVQFWITAGDTYTFHYDLPWGYTVNGVTNNNREHRYERNSGWVMLATFNIYTDTTVTFRLFSTGLSAFGGPTTFNQAIQRATVPQSPWFPVLSEITANSMRLKWDVANDGGAPIDQKQVGRNTIPSTSSATILASTGDDVYSGLAPGTTYYWWSRVRNSKGYSGWSDMSTASTISVGGAPNPVQLSFPSQTTMVALLTDTSNGGSPILERELAYNTANVVGSATAVPYVDNPTIIEGLQPATTYYVWGRVRNSAGWSPYSPVASLRTIAGAYITVNGEVKEAIPYVRDGGVWKLARPWLRHAGVWKQAG